MVELLLFWLTSPPVGAILSSGAENNVYDKELDESRTGIIYTEDCSCIIQYMQMKWPWSRIFVMGHSTDSPMRWGSNVIYSGEGIPLGFSVKCLLMIGLFLF